MHFFNSKELLGLLFFGLGGLGCGSNAVQAPDLPPLEALKLDLQRDIRDNLQRHYDGAAAKPPRTPPEQKIYFDYLEDSRQLNGADQASISGPFLFARAGQELQRGRITLFFSSRNGAWTYNGRFVVEEESVPSQTLMALVKSGPTGKPLAQATVEAHRLGEGGRSARPARTDAEGIAHLEVLQGTFEVAAAHPSYRTPETARVVVGEQRRSTAALRLHPLASGERVP